MVNCRNCYYWEGRDHPWPKNTVAAFHDNGVDGVEPDAEGAWGNCRLHASAMGMMHRHALAFASDHDSYEANSVTNENYGCVDGEMIDEAFCN